MAVAKGALLRRGFKAASERIANDLRAQLGLSPMDRLDPRALADLMRIPVVALTDLEAPESAIRHFTLVEPGAFSALTVCVGDERLIVVNDAHADTRQASSLTHELAHSILKHPPHAAVHGGTGCRHFDPRLEAEAEQLTVVLLVTDRAAMRIARSSLDLALAAEELGISVERLRQRINQSGAQQRVSAERAKRQRVEQT